MNIKWTEFQNHVTRSFELFRNDSYLHDVTLVSDDYKHISAHKLVLSTSSEYFRNILQQTKQSQPLICLDGVSSHILESVLQYVYVGEVNVLHDDMEQFMNVATRLKLDGFMSSEDEFEEKSVYVEPPPEIMNKILQQKNENENNKKFEPPRMNDELESRASVIRKEKIQEVKIKVENQGTPTVQQLDPLISDDIQMENFLLHKVLQENVLENPNSSLSCTLCGKICRGKKRVWMMRQHMLTHVSGSDSFKCN